MFLVDDEVSSTGALGIAYQLCSFDEVLREGRTILALVAVDRSKAGRQLSEVQTFRTEKLVKDGGNVSLRAESFKLAIERCVESRVERKAR